MSKEKKYEKDSNSDRFIGKYDSEKRSGNFNDGKKGDLVVNTAPPPPPRKPSGTKYNE
jgi:hypothetical protein